MQFVLVQVCRHAIPVELRRYFFGDIKIQQAIMLEQPVQTGTIWRLWLPGHGLGGEYQRNEPDVAFLTVAQRHLAIAKQQFRRLFVANNESLIIHRIFPDHDIAFAKTGFSDGPEVAHDRGRGTDRAVENFAQITDHFGKGPDPTGGFDRVGSTDDGDLHGHGRFPRGAAAGRGRSWLGAQTDTGNRSGKRWGPFNKQRSPGGPVHGAADTL